MFRLLGLFVLCAVAFADERAPLHSPSIEQQRQMDLHNSQQQLIDPGVLDDLAPVRPVAEHEEARFLLFNETFDFGSDPVKRGLLQNLPKGVEAIIVAGSSSSEQSVRARFGSWIEKSRLRVVVMPSGSPGFWARDGFPIPVYLNDGADPEVGLVRARYYHGNNPGPDIAKYLKLQLSSLDYYFEGGNFAANKEGTCISITRNIPESTFMNTYGCKKWVRFEHLTGIGHVDEVIKFVDDRHVVTNRSEYVSKLEENGFKVTMVPNSSKSVASYINSLLINGTMYVPTYNDNNDEKAVNVFKSLGYKVVPVDASQLYKGKGSVHCITMTYPETARRALYQWLGIES